MNLTRRHFLQAGSTASLAAVAAGCSKVDVPEVLLPGRRPLTVPEGPYVTPAGNDIDLVSHALNRLTFGPRPWDYQSVRKLGPTEEAAFAAFLDQQLAPERIDDPDGENAVRRFEVLNEPLGELFEYQEKHLLDALVRATVLRAVFSERQLYEVMVNFWSDHFNIDPSKGDAKWLKVADDRDVVRAHALGNFPAMLRASALSPAMLWYLDGRVNKKGNDADKPNENYARELLELHTLGVHGGYTQKDVMEVARCLTGWTVKETHHSQFGLGNVEFKPFQHDRGEKVVLGHVIPRIPKQANAEKIEELGRAELDTVLGIIGLHPATAKFLATKLCQRFIADEPPAAAVSAVAEKFIASGGDIPTTLRTLFATEGFLTTRGNKLKRPFHYIVSALRATHATTDASHAIQDYLLRMGHAPFHYPTPDGYPEKAAPWLGTLLWRWNFAVALTKNELGNETKIDAEKLNASFKSEEGLMAHLLGRAPTADEVTASKESGATLALMLAAPSFQKC
ncbi:MAG: DUF1800 domain-containing protein [Proteobacteria bacterium]|nr:DUF1800 domain-containing protein [Pseudomonadota bacterium]